MTDLPTLAAALVVNFRTIRFSASDASSTRPDPSHSDWWTTAKARRAERLTVDTYRRQLRSQLVKHGDQHYLDHLDADPAGGWRFHIFVADDHALSLLVDTSKGQWGLGDPVVFDPEEFVAQSLGCLKEMASDFE